MAGNDTNTKLLLHLDSDFNDASTAAHNATAVGNAALSTTQIKFGAKSCVFDGTGDYLTVASHADFTPGSGNFTVDFWLRLTALPGSAPGAALWTTDAGAAVITAVALSLDTSGVIRLYSSSDGTTWNIANNASLGAVGATGSWQHIAIVRNGTAITAYINGVANTAGTMSGTTIASAGIYIGGMWQSTGGTAGINGYIDELRYSNIARWTSNFTPPTAPYGVDTTVAAAAGAYVLTGVAAGLKAGKGMVAAVGSYALTGVAAGLKAARRMAAVVGAYTLTGVTARLGKGYTVVAATGSYTLTGVAAALKAAWRMTAAVGSYALTGVAAAVKAARRMAAATGSYALTGVAATFRAARKLTAATGSYIVTGVTLIEALLPVDPSKFYIRRVLPFLQKFRGSDPTLDQ